MTTDTIYDHPLYYDILFGWDRGVEAAFYAGVLADAGVGRGEPVLEVACGSGQVARRLARRGFAMTGLDLSDAMLAFLRDLATSDGTRIRTLCADMADFEVPAPFAAAINPLSSFRLLHDAAAVRAHLACIAAALRPGGIYVLDMEFAEVDSGESVTTDEEWDMERGGVIVRATNACVLIDDHGTRLELAWGAELHLLAYTVAGFEALVRESGAFTVASWHPELRVEGEDVSRFPVAPAARPETGRTMVVLVRTRST